MRHQNSVFHSLLKHVPWPVFDKLVDEHRADARVRRLTTKSQFVALLYGQLSGATSLREIEMAMASHAARLYHLGAGEVSRIDAGRCQWAAPACGLFRAFLGDGRPGEPRPAARHP